MEYSDILKWAAGANIKIDPKIKYDSKILLELVGLHNLSGRFLYRIQQEKIGWATPKLLKDLKKLHDNIKRKVSRNIQAFSHLQKLLPNKIDIVMIKGASTYVLCNDESVMRFGDIDILSNNPSIVVKTLVRKGYKLTKAPFMHEIGEYSKEKIEFDIHEYFPVYSYSTQLRKAKLTKFSRAKSQKNDYAFKSKKITFKDLYRYTLQTGKTRRYAGNVTDPNLLAIIICAHAFMNYTNMWSISHRKKAYVRLGEIADLFSLSQHNDFEKSKFSEYVDRYDARDCVAWAANISTSLFGTNPLPIKIKNRDISLSKFPRCLWWNFWTCFPEQLDDLLFPNWMSISKITKYIGASTVTPTTTIYSDNLKRCFSKNNRLIPASFNFQLKQKSLIVEIKIHKTTKSSIDRIRIDFGKYATEWELDNIKKTAKTTGDNEISCSYKDGRDTHDVAFEINLRKLDLDNKDHLPMLLGIAKHNSAGKMIISNLFPLKVKIKKKE